VWRHEAAPSPQPLSHEGRGALQAFLPLPSGPRLHLAPFGGAFVRLG
jgi:hypothetical protein